MKPTKDDHWQKLVALARQAPAQDAASAAAPFGFSTRLAALAFQPEKRSLASLFEPFALRALSVASVLAVVACVVNLNPVVQAVHDEISVFEREPVSGLVDL